ncbi:proton-coupled folate transporter-like isoform X2 [Panulirus ornatus]|uniref:proton-coupled folate transporter-like isoform X2 n=1 Tax=Panulirus ornatus TaxID=150431 RepID=UPI003A8B6B67
MADTSKPICEEETSSSSSTPATLQLSAVSSESDLGWSKRLSAWARNISVEPLLFFHNLCSQVVWVASQDLMEDNACLVNCGLSEKVCGDLIHHDTSQATVQMLVTEYLMYRSIFETSIKMVWVLVLGSWSDRWGRRIPLIVSLSGLLGEAAIYLFNALTPSWRLEMNLIASLLYAVSGGSHALLMLSFAHLADNSKPSKRTVLMGLLDAAYYLGSPVGTALVGPLLEAGGYPAAFTLVIAVYALCIIYVIARISQPMDEECEVDDEGCGKVCEVSQVFEAVQVTVQRRPHHITTYILLLILAMLSDSLPVWGEGNVNYSFVKRTLDWTHTQYSHWGSFASLLSVCVMILLMPVLSMVMGVPDGWMGVMGGLSKTFGSLIYGFVTSPKLAWLLWTGAVVSSAKNMAPVAIRSLLSKLAGPQDVGKVYAVMATGESLLPFAAAPIYKSVYTATLNSHPATYNFISAGFYLILTLILLGVMLSLSRVSETAAIMKGASPPTAQ